MSPRVRIYYSPTCPYCMMAERLLREKGVTDMERIRVDHDLSLREEMKRLTGRRTVPQIYIGDTHVGGYDDLAALNHKGALDPLLAGGQ